ncbi:MAG: pyruvate carboxylase [Magnetococcales bacterium]|nr:pyruvate carboxylase [Magnetococcales bacterium]NGZ05380.1 pyruvate carboxylase [Magnetococcales bacterium]
MTDAKPFKRLLVANRGEIAIRIIRAAAEMNIETVAIYAQEDSYSLHRYKADESYPVGAGKRPIAAYLDIADILRIATDVDVDAIHPGYGFLSENPDFAEACQKVGIVFVGPTPEAMRLLGDKVQARRIAVEAGVPVMPATETLPNDPDRIRAMAAEIGYPLMLKAIWGGGGRGMRVIESADTLLEQVQTASREAAAAFGNGAVYLEKLVRRARHVEVQILGDQYGNLVHLYERDCTVQRRNQKVVERAPALYLNDQQREELCGYALRLARAVGYRNAGTVEFLQDVESGLFYFIEVNPRIQVEHTVTEEVTGIDLVQAQILVAQGKPLGTPGLPRQEQIALHGHAMQCRVTTEDPENNFTPDYGRISDYRSAAGMGIRLDAGTAYSGARITPFYDSLLVKITAWAATSDAVIQRMARALQEFRIVGLKTNLGFLSRVVRHDKFRTADYATTFIDETPSLVKAPDRKDNHAHLLHFIADVVVNGNPETKGLTRPDTFAKPFVPVLKEKSELIPGTRDLLDELGPKKFADWMLEQKRTLITDTTMRDAHQSLLATRLRTYDLLAIAPAYARLLPGLFSVECWGGATFDVTMRFLKECPWERLHHLHERMPNLLLQMLLRSANGVGYTNYPDNVVRFFIRQSAARGVDLFRVFDSLNWVENMRVAMDAVASEDKLCEAAICYTGDIIDPRRTKYSLNYYVSMAKELEAAGAHILGIKDMAGLLKPNAARVLVKALKEEVGIPIHFHTHDTSGISAASVLSAIEAGVDAVDAAMDAMSGATSQPSLGSIVEALRNTPHDTGLDIESIRSISTYWEQVRRHYAGFESRQYAGASEVYLHEMPGGQFTNLRQQARSLGIDAHWDQVAHAYARVNELFGDIPKVTPSSKVVGDMALMMVTSQLTAEDVLDPDKEIAFPSSVVQYFRGDLGQPPGGFPQALQRKVLKNEVPLTERPGAVLPDTDLEEQRRVVAGLNGGGMVSDAQLASYLMYPQVYGEFVRHCQGFGDVVSRLPTPVFFYGMEPGQEIQVESEPGKALNIHFVTASEPDRDGMVKVFFEVNGQPRSILMQNRTKATPKRSNPKARDGDDTQVGSPIPGAVGAIAVVKGQKVARGDRLLSLEAMKMETAVCATRDGVVVEIHVQTGDHVETKDLLVTLGGAA